MNYRLKIKPAIPVTDRHKLQCFLVKLGYEIVGGGQCTDGSSCDVSFEDKEGGEE